MESPHQAWPNAARGPTGWRSSSLRPGDAEDADLGDATSIIFMSAAGPNCPMHLVEKKGGKEKQRAAHRGPVANVTPQSFVLEEDSWTPGPA